MRFNKVVICFLILLLLSRWTLVSFQSRWMGFYQNRWTWHSWSEDWLSPVHYSIFFYVWIWQKEFLQMCTLLFHGGWNQLTFQMWKCVWPYSFLCEFNCFFIDSMLIADVAAFHHRNFIQRIPWNKKSNEFQETQKCHISKACKDRNQREKK